METPPNFRSGVVACDRFSTGCDLAGLIDIFINLIRAALPVIAGLALLVFLWGLAKFIFRVSGDEKAVADGKNLMKWGLIALFLLVSFWSIIRLVYGDIGFGSFSGLPYLKE